MALLKGQPRGASGRVGRLGDANSSAAERKYDAARSGGGMGAGTLAKKAASTTPSRMAPTGDVSGPRSAVNNSASKSPCPSGSVAEVKNLLCQAVQLEEEAEGMRESVEALRQTFVEALVQIESMQNEGPDAFTLSDEKLACQTTDPRPELALDEVKACLNLAAQKMSQAKAVRGQAAMRKAQLQDIVLQMSLLDDPGRGVVSTSGRPAPGGVVTSEVCTAGRRESRGSKASSEDRQKSEVPEKISRAPSGCGDQCIDAGECVELDSVSSAISERRFSKRNPETAICDSPDLTVELGQQDRGIWSAPGVSSIQSLMVGSDISFQDKGDPAAGRRCPSFRSLKSTSSPEVDAASSSQGGGVLTSSNCSTPQVEGSDVALPQGRVDQMISHRSSSSSAWTGTNVTPSSSALQSRKNSSESEPAGGPGKQLRSARQNPDPSRKLSAQSSSSSQKRMNLRTLLTTWSSVSSSMSSPASSLAGAPSRDQSSHSSPAMSPLLLADYFRETWSASLNPLGMTIREAAPGIGDAALYKSSSSKVTFKSPVTTPERQKPSEMAADVTAMVRVPDLYSHRRQLRRKDGSEALLAELEAARLGELRRRARIVGVDSSCFERVADGHMTRRDFMFRILELEEFSDAATTIQRWFRGCMVRQHLSLDAAAALLCG